MDFVPRTVMIGGKVLATMLAKIIVFDWYVKMFGERDLLLCYKMVTFVHKTTSKNSAV